MLEFKVECVRLGARAASKKEAIEQVAELLAANGFIDPRYVASMLARERQANTYLGLGIAIPHGLPGDRDLIQATGIAVVQFPEGVDWQEGERSHLVVGIAARGDEHLEILSRLTGLLQQKDLVERLAGTGDAREIVAALAGSIAPTRSVDPNLILDDALRVQAHVGPATGLHARPSTALAALARSFTAKIRLGFQEQLVDAKSMATILALGAPHGAPVEILAQGPDAAQALEALQALLESEEVAEASSSTVRHDWQPEAQSFSLSGVATSPGLAIARVHHLSVLPQVETENVAHQGTPQQEAARFATALETSRSQLQELHRQVSTRTDAATAQIFSAQQEMLDDPVLRERVETLVAAGTAAVAAWKQTIQELADSLTNSGNLHVAARVADVRDIENRLLANFSGTMVAATLGESPEPVLLVARELTPSQTASLDPQRIAGFCTVEGGATSHVAVLARSLAIPAVTGADEAILALAEGQLVILDADAGRLYPTPSSTEVESAQKALKRLQGNLELAWQDRFEPAITRDGHRLEVVANITGIEGAEKAIEAGGEGVGLLRSEFLFLGREQAPDEEEQFEAYRAMLRALGGLPMVLRTLDIGGDKSAPYIQVPHEDNPFLGVRGIRLCLRQPDLLRPQLRAAYRASVDGPLRIMFPMVTSIGELRAAKHLAEEIRQELGVPPVPIGVMIEVPAAALLADVLAREADFFSIGTNDLTQYVLAMDRGNPQLAREAQGTHPAVLRMIALTVEAAHRHGKWVGVCGGLAGELSGAALLAGLGVDELSMALPDIARVKSHLRALRLDDLQGLARRALECEDAEAVQALLKESEPPTQTTLRSDLP
jgi:phosphocarrier protein FPr